LNGSTTGTVAVTVVGITVAGAENLAEGEVGEHVQIAGLLLRGYLQGVIVGPAAMGLEIDVPIVVERSPVICIRASGAVIPGVGQAGDMLLSAPVFGSGVKNAP
jgi:hypothetical protein